VSKLLVTSTALWFFYFTSRINRVNIFSVCWLLLLELVFAGITKPSLCNASSFSGRLINAVLHQNREFNPDSLCIFNNLSMTKDSIHFGSGSFFGIFAEQCQALFLLKSV
jgi:hypothetical protein